MIVELELSLQGSKNVRRVRNWAKTMKSMLCKHCDSNGGWYSKTNKLRRQIVVVKLKL